MLRIEEFKFDIICMLIDSCDSSDDNIIKKYNKYNKYFLSKQSIFDHRNDITLAVYNTLIDKQRNYYSFLIFRYAEMNLKTISTFFKFSQDELLKFTEYLVDWLYSEHTFCTVQSNFEAFSNVIWLIITGQNGFIQELSNPENGIFDYYNNLIASRSLAPTLAEKIIENDFFTGTSETALFKLIINNKINPKNMGKTIKDVADFLDAPNLNIFDIQCSLDQIEALPCDII